MSFYLPLFINIHENQFFKRNFKKTQDNFYNTVSFFLILVSFYISLLYLSLPLVFMFNKREQILHYHFSFLTEFLFWCGEFFISFSISFLVRLCQQSYTFICNFFFMKNTKIY